MNSSTYQFTEDTTVRGERYDQNNKSVVMHPGEAVSPATIHQIFGDVEAGMRLVHDPRDGTRRILVWIVAGLVMVAGIGVYLYRRKTG